jgi:hypothetical protein
MKKLLLLAACLSGCSYSNIQSNMSVSKLEQYRYDTLKTIRNHIDKHNDANCILNKLYPIIETMDLRLRIPYGFTSISAYAEGDVIYINQGIKRSKDSLTITLIHEALHKYGECLNDRFKSDKPVCHLFGRAVYDSIDLSKYIEDHLREY